MSTVTKLNISFIVFVLPSIAYFVVNGYWWLFDGNHPIAPKMWASVFVSWLGTLIYVSSYPRGKKEKS